MITKCEKVNLLNVTVVLIKLLELTFRSRANPFRGATILGTAVTGYEESRQLLVNFLTVYLKGNLN